VQGELDRRVPAQLVEKGPVAVGEGPAEDVRKIPHGLVIVHREEKGDVTHEDRERPGGSGLSLALFFLVFPVVQTLDVAEMQDIFFALGVQGSGLGDQLLADVAGDLLLLFLSHH
jgi:hypothetical protein